jgi:hypothetical protein
MNIGSGFGINPECYEEYLEKACELYEKISQTSQEAFSFLGEYKFSSDAANAAAFFGATAVLLGGGIYVGAIAALGSAILVNSLSEETVEAVKEGIKWSFVGGTVISGGNPFVGLAASVASTAGTLLSQVLGPAISKGDGKSMTQYERLIRRFGSMIAGNGVSIALAGFNPSLLVASAVNVLYDVLYGQGEKTDKATPIFNM